jgi:hypothetical protein
VEGTQSRDERPAHQQLGVAVQNQGTFAPGEPAQLSALLKSVQPASAAHAASPLSKLTIPSPAAPAVKPRSIMEALKAASQRKLQAATLSATLKTPQGLYQKAYHPNGLIEGMQKAFPKHIAGYDNNNFYVKTKYGGPLAQFLKTNHVSAVWDREKGAWRVDRMYADKVGKFLHMNPQTYGRAEQPTTYMRGQRSR